MDAESPPARAPAPAKPAAPVQANFFQEISMTKMGENMGKTINQAIVTSTFVGRKTPTSESSESSESESESELMCGSDIFHPYALDLQQLNPNHFQVEVEAVKPKTLPDAKFKDSDRRAVELWWEKPCL